MSTMRTDTYGLHSATPAQMPFDATDSSPTAGPPRVSVVIIFFNEERFLPEAVASVLAQTYRDWELLLVDDGSRDAGPSIAAGFAREHPGRIHVIAHAGRQNLGMSASRNAGVAAARGDLITFLDADDVWLPDKLASQVAALDRHPDAALAVGRAEWWYSWTDDQGPRTDFVQRFPLPLDTVVPPPAVLTMFLADEWTSLCDVLIRRSAFDAVGGYDPAFRGMHEDQVFHAKLCLEHPAYLMSQVGYRYRQHDRSCVSRTLATEGWRPTRRRYLEWLASHLDRRGANDPALRRTLREQLFHVRHPTLARARARLRTVLAAAGVRGRAFR